MVDVPRRPRIEYPGALYHVMSRGVEKRKTFMDDCDRRAFLRVLGEIVAMRVLIIHAFCLMPNHFHLLTETPQGLLARWMQLLLGDFAQRFNYRHQRVGHLFQGRYKAILVEDGDYFLECSRYIHLNPSRAGIARTPELYRWSSYRNFVGGRPVVDWVDTERTLALFESRDHYRRFVESGGEESSASPFERAKAGLVLGGEAFVEAVQRMLKRSTHDQAEATLRALSLSRRRTAPEDVIAAVREVFVDWSPCQRRRVEMFALRTLDDRSTAEIGRLLGTSPSAVSKATGSLRARISEDGELAERIDLVARRLRSDAGPSGN